MAHRISSAGSGVRSKSTSVVGGPPVAQICALHGKWLLWTDLMSKWSGVGTTVKVGSKTRSPLIFRSWGASKKWQ